MSFISMSRMSFLVVRVKVYDKNHFTKAVEKKLNEVEGSEL